MIQDIFVYIIIGLAIAKCILAILSFVKSAEKKIADQHCPGCTSCESSPKMKYPVRF